MTISLLTLKRNDVSGAIKLARLYMRDGNYGPEIAETLLMYQNDPTELLEKLEPIYQKYKRKEK